MSEQTMGGRVIVLGSINRDLVLRVPHLARPGETVAGSDIAEFPGGKGANQAVAAARMGARVALVGAIGRDGAGQAMRSFLEAENLDLSGLKELADTPTGMAVIQVDQRGENCIVVVAGANAKVGGAWPISCLPARGDLIVSQFEIALTSIIAAFRSARAQGARTLLNPAPFQTIPADLAGLVDILVLNESELAAALGRELGDSIPEIEAGMRALRAKMANPELTLIATLGKAGAILLDSAGTNATPGREVAAVDTTGAGDCFVGALAAAITAGYSSREAMARANHAASLSVTRVGAAASMPFLAEL